MLLNVLILLMLVAVLISVAKNLLSHKNGNGTDRRFLGKDSTNAMRGFAIIMIALSHICQYENSLKESLIGGKIVYTILFSWGAIGVSMFFLLSGYGCYLSLFKAERYGKWLAKHLIKMLIHFIVVFILVICILSFVSKLDIQLVDCLFNFITLRLPGSTVWYFKIQILFYIILAISMRISKKNACMIVVAFSLCYALIADFAIGLPDYWWKTSLCFMAGCFMAKYKDNVERLLRGNVRNLTLLLVGCLAYCVILKDSHYIFLLQIISYMILAFCIVMIWDWFVKSNCVLQKVGKYSLDIYLVHIGLVEGIFFMNIDVNIKIIIFIFSTAIITILCYQVSEFVNKKVQRGFGNLIYNRCQKRRDSFSQRSS